MLGCRISVKHYNVIIQIDRLNIEVNQTQSEALFFANEVYHTSGPVEHVVLNQQMGLKPHLPLPPEKLLLSINEQTGFIMEQTEHVGSKEAFGKSLWKSAKYLDRIGNAAKQFDPEQKIATAPEWKKISEMSLAAEKLLEIKKNPVMDDNAKSTAALKIVNEIGINGVAEYQKRVLELNVILNQQIRMIPKE
ncbi:MAG TPA: hypothetical protein DEG17_04435 [Cyanobacteria bacterium UBA11149]|nr:hypothetical protein [Cyanobacteria bacterium UBA11366]HBR77145.1 hypothetical protein [Cyanobacteria bacterium UBA11159]HBS71214.1 hypothetical protein [Cyanobacteria bacterium UBA11153]HBW88138.1 hypothetical protein [Cyanobacteria bacterium UBA11149]